MMKCEEKKHNNCPPETKLRLATWFIVKWLYKMWMSKNDNKLQVMKEMLKEVDWNSKMGRLLKSQVELTLSLF